MALFDFLKRKKKKEKVKEEKEIKQEVAESKVSKITGKHITARILGDVVRPHVTERSRDMSRAGVYMFRVAENATKSAIAQAIEAIYQVSVRRVRVMRIPSKPRRRGLTRGTKKGYKKAAVTLRQGDHIELFS